ncbi:hypothetical protein [Niveispirillum fermenti]|uniref:hypothetical protein n=1 Tax=Niveispirillum fermenti TaxID=1233113 RepID=UPI003A86A7C4
MSKQWADSTGAELEDAICRLTSQLERIDHNIQALKRDRQLVADELNRTRQALAKRRVARPEPTVSAHALLRYLERVLEIDLKTMESALLTPTVRQAMQAGATRVTINGVDFVIKDNVIVTVLN